MHVCPSQSRLRSHAAAIAPRTIPILDRFVTTLAAACPAARQVFPLETKRQRYEAACVVSRVVKGIGNVDSIQPWLFNLGRRLGLRGLTTQHASIARHAMLDAIRRASGSNWSTDIESDWRTTLDAVFSTVAAGLPAERTSLPARRAA